MTVFEGVGVSKVAAAFPPRSAGEEGWGLALAVWEVAAAFPPPFTGEEGLGPLAARLRPIDAPASRIFAPRLTGDCAVPGLG